MVSRRFTKLRIGFFVISFVFLASQGAFASKIEGIWKKPENGALIRLEHQGDTLVGYIEKGADGREDKKDEKNPNPALRNRPIKGIQIIKNFKKSQHQDKWTGGTIYAADEGKTYDAHITLKEDDTLELRGYVGIPLFGRTQILKKVSK